MEQVIDNQLIATPILETGVYAVHNAPPKKIWLQLKFFTYAPSEQGMLQY